MPDAPESTEIVKDLSNAYEAIRALRECTEPDLFFKFMNGIPLVKAFGDKMLAHPSARIVVRHRQEGDLLPDGTAPQMGPACLATTFETYDDNDPTDDLPVAAWEAVCAAVEVLCLQDFVMQAPEGMRQVTIGRSDDALCFLELLHIEHNEPMPHSTKRQSNDLLCLMLAEFAGTFGIPYRAVAEMRAALEIASAKVRTAN